jgi:hypothetical protein
MDCTASAQSRPTCPEAGAVVVAFHQIAAEARTYALIQLPRGINQAEAFRIASQCRFAGKAGFLATFAEPDSDDSEWKAVRSRFGASLGGQRVENAWLGARMEGDGIVRWAGTGQRVTNVSRWKAWAPNEPQSKTGVTFHSGYPGLFNSCFSTDRYTRLMVEFNMTR